MSYDPFMVLFPTSLKATLSIHCQPTVYYLIFHGKIM